jgi:hypothetical protein
MENFMICIMLMLLLNFYHWLQNVYGIKFMKLQNKLYKLIFLIFLIWSTPSKSQADEDLIACYGSVLLMLEYDNQLTGTYLKKLNRQQGDLLLSYFDKMNNIELDIKRKSGGDMWDERTIAQRNLNKNEAALVRMLNYKLPQQVAQQNLQRGGQACQKNGHFILASLASAGLNKLTAENSRVSGSQNANEKKLQDLLKQYDAQIRNHPYYELCPAYNQSRQQCATAGSYDTCMNIKFGSRYRSVQESNVCN